MSAPHHPHDHDHPDIPPPVVEEVSEGVFAYVQLDGSWGLNNTGFLVGSAGVTVIDTCFTERRTRAFLEAVAERTDRPIRTLVNTHHHGDHTHGNWLLPAATVVGHERCREEVLAAGHVATAFFPGVEWGRLEVAPPFVTFEDRLNVYVDDLRVELHFLGPAHTTNDVVAWIPERHLLFAGDLVFNGGTPFVVMGSVAGSITAIERLRTFDAETIVPGHGSVCDPGILDGIAAYLRFVQDTALAGFDAGLSPLETAQQAGLGPYAGWLDPERLVGNLWRAYSELQGEAQGAPITPQAFADMVTYNGGEPLRCLA